MSPSRHRAIGTGHQTFPLAQLERASAEMAGFCISCGAEHEGVDPDGRGDPCECCGRASVYGAEELVLMGRAR